jgi:hypothetical protein
MTVRTVGWPERPGDLAPPPDLPAGGDGHGFHGFGVPEFLVRFQGRRRRKPDRVQDHGLEEADDGVQDTEKQKGRA